MAVCEMRGRRRAMGRGGAIDGGLQNAGKASSDGAWRRDWWRFAKWVESVERWGVAARLVGRNGWNVGDLRAF